MRIPLLHPMALSRLSYEYLDEIYRIIDYGFGIPSLCLSCLTIFLIVKHTPKEMKVYGRLLLHTAVIKTCIFSLLIPSFAGLRAGDGILRMHFGPSDLSPALQCPGGQRTVTTITLSIRLEQSNHLHSALWTMHNCRNNVLCLSLSKGKCDFSR
jgi:hypothetical protein